MKFYEGQIVVSQMTIYILLGILWKSILTFVKKIEMMKDSSYFSSFL